MQMIHADFKELKNDVNENKGSWFRFSPIWEVARASIQEGILTYLSVLEGWLVCLFELTWIAEKIYSHPLVWGNLF